MSTSNPGIAADEDLPANKAIQREREKLHAMTDSHQCFKPIPTLMGELNRRLKGWAKYFSFGYPMSAYCEIERHVQGRLIQHLQRRSQDRTSLRKERPG